MKLQEQISRIKSIMGLLFEETGDKCPCGDGTLKQECCEPCKCNDGSYSEECCGELTKMKTLPASELSLNEPLTDKIIELPKREELTIDTTDVPQDLLSAMDDYGITHPLEKAHFLAQCKVESDGFKATTEYASGRAYENRCEDLGNCSPGDGVKYRGRGYIQLTGKSNYTAFNKWLKEKGYTDDVVKNPELVATKYPGEVSAWFWSVLGPLGNKNFPSMAKRGASLEVVDKIGTWVNGGNPPNGYKERRKYFYDFIGKNENDLASNK
jgi:predicted chitinase